MNALTTTAPQHSQPTVLRPQTMTELLAFAQVAAKSSMMPRDYIGKPENIVIAVQMGSELGLAPMQAIQNIAVISGKPSVYGDAMLGLVKQSPLCEDVVESVKGDGDRMVAICVAKRVGKKPVERSFSVDDAKKANLWGKAGPWSQYPNRMLQMRARGFALRDAFPDVLRGLISAEEAADFPTIEGSAEPEAPKSDLRSAINRDVPMAETKKMTLREWMDDFEARCRAAQDKDEAEVILKEEAVLRLDDPDLKINESARQRALAARQAMIDRIWREPEDEEEEAPHIKGEEYVAG